MENISINIVNDRYYLKYKNEIIAEYIPTDNVINIHKDVRINGSTRITKNITSGKFNSELVSYNGKINISNIDNINIDQGGLLCNDSNGWKSIIPINYIDLVLDNDMKTELIDGYKISYCDDDVLYSNFILPYNVYKNSIWFNFFYINNFTETELTINCKNFTTTNEYIKNICIYNEFNKICKTENIILPTLPDMFLKENMLALNLKNNKLKINKIRVYYKTNLINQLD